MKKILIGSIIILTVGIIKTSGNGASPRRIQYSETFIELTIEASEQKDFLLVEDGVYVKPSYALDLFDELYD